MSINWTMEQGSEEWHQKRLGKPTASQFHRIITKTGLLSDQRHDYRNELLAERILGREMERFRKNEWMVRGQELEAEAAEHFQQHQQDIYGRSMELDRIGYVTTDDQRLGCSPDRVVRNGGGNAAREAVELKCPAAWTHIGYLLRGLGDDYKAQVQGQMLVGEFDLVHFYSYHPELPPFYQLTVRHRGYIDRLHTRLAAFLEELEEGYRTLKEMKGWPNDPGIR